MAGNEVTLNGHCLQAECNAKFFAFSENGQSRLTIQVTPANGNIRHDKKNQIRGKLRKEILDMLKTDKAMVVVAKIANECLRIGDVEPPFLPNSSALRKIKAGRHDHLVLHRDPMVSIREMKYTEPYLNSIGNIGFDPFDVFFATPYQKTLLQKELLLCDDIHEAKVIIEHLFIVLLNRFQYDDVVTNAIAFLKNVTDTHIIPEDVANGISTEESAIKFTSDEEKNFMAKKDKHKFFKWIGHLLEDVKIYVNTELNDSIEHPSPDMAENPFYAPEIEKRVVVFLSKIHQWSNVMMTSFGSTNATATSAGSESHFNILKSVIFPNEKKIRADIFIRRYIDYLNGITVKSIVSTNTKKMEDHRSAEELTMNGISDDDFDMGTFYNTYILLFAFMF